jgi:hypothetical protein
MQAEVEVKLNVNQDLAFSTLASTLTFQKVGGLFQHPAGIFSICLALVSTLSRHRKTPAESRGGKAMPEQANPTL